MPHTSVVPTPPAGDAATEILDPERLDCYNVAVEFQVLATTLLPTAQRVLRDQLDRASVSIVLNISEGTGRRSRRDKSRFYAMARGSAMECAAIVNLSLVRDLAPYLDCRRGRIAARADRADADEAADHAERPALMATLGVIKQGQANEHVHGERRTTAPRVPRPAGAGSPLVPTPARAASEAAEPHRGIPRHPSPASDPARRTSP